MFKAKQSGLLVSIITQSTSVLPAYKHSAFLQHSINCNAFHSLLCLLISHFQLYTALILWNSLWPSQDPLKLFVLLKLDSISLQFTSTYTTVPRTIQCCHSTSESGVGSGAVRIGTLNTTHSVTHSQHFDLHATLALYKFVIHWITLDQSFSKHLTISCWPRRWDSPKYTAFHRHRRLFPKKTTKKPNHQISATARHLWISVQGESKN